MNDGDIGQRSVPRGRPESEDFAASASWDVLKQRARCLRQVRRFFDNRDFVEVETPLLSHDTVVDLHLEPIAVANPVHSIDGTAGTPCWLQTSPEFGMKRLLASGADSIYQVTRAFRGGESGTLHNPEFTIVEWYRVGDRYEEGIGLLEEFAKEVLEHGQPERLTYKDAFSHTIGFDPHSADVTTLAKAAACHGINPDVLHPTASRDDWLHLLMSHCVEPRLGSNRPVILFDYPHSQAALARIRSGTPPVAERFELYWKGIELANGYHELLDPQVLVVRNQAVNRQRAATGKQLLPCHSRLEAAMRSGLPPCSGVALGFDRLVMLKTGCNEIQHVMAFPFPRA